MTHQSTRGLRRQFMNLWIAQGISQFGDALLEITLPVWVGLVTKSATQVAGVATAELLPAIIVGPIAGVVAERFNPKKIMILTDTLRALTVLLLLAFHGVGTAYFAYIVSFLLSLGTRIFTPAQSVLVRQSIRDEDIPKAQGSLHIASSVSLALGPAIGGTLLLRMGPAPAVLLDAGTFVVSITFLLKIPQEDGRRADPAESMPSGSVRSIRREVVQGLRYILERGALLGVAIVTAMLTLVGFIWFTVDVFYVKHYLGVPGEAVGYLWTASGMGNLLAGLIIVPLARKANLAYLMVGGLFLRAIALVFYAVIGQFSYAVLICLFAGFGEGMASIALSTRAMQYSLPSVMGRVSSILDIIGQFSGIGATILIATIGSNFTSQEDLLGCGLLLSMTTILALYWTWKKRGRCEIREE